MSNTVHNLAEEAAQVAAQTPNELELQVEYEGKTYSVPANFIDAFARLVVRECADRIDNLITCNDDGDQILDCDDVRTELLEHFGVEE